MLRLYTARTLATKAAAPRKRATKAAMAAALQRPALRRNAKRVHAAMAETAIASVAQSLARATPRRVLGLDINTNSTGYAVLDGDGRVVKGGQISTAHVASSDVLGIAHVISEALRDVHQAAATGGDASEWLVGIEDFMRMYRFGQFHNKGIFQLAQLNGIVSYACWQRFGCRPVHTHPTAARALFGIVAGSASAQANAKAERKSSEASVKEQAMAFVLDRERDSDAAQALRATHVNRLQQWTDAAYDIADAYVVADYTRWMALQGELQQHPELVRQFSAAYLSLALPAEVEEEGETTTTKKKTKKQPTTVEATALRSMNTAAQHAYLSELFASGVADWVKQQQQPEAEAEN